MPVPSWLRIPAPLVAVAASAALLAGCGSAATSGGTGGATASNATSTASSGGCAAGAAASGTTLVVPQEPDSGVDKTTGNCWASIKPTTMGVADVGSAVAGTSATFAVAWSPKDLYIRAYAVTWPLNNAGGANWWQSDATEFDISGADDHAGAFTDGNQYQLAITSDGTLQTSGDNGAAASPAPTALVQVVQNKGFYTELIVPWATLQVSAPKKGQKYQFDIGQDFGDSGGNRLAQMVWQADPSKASSSDWHQDTSQWGDIQLG
jgi:hypothetical protein